MLEVERASRSAEPAIRRAAWNVAAASGAPDGIAILEARLAQAEAHPAAVVDMLEAVGAATGGAAHAWMLSRIEPMRAWVHLLSGTELESARRRLEQTLDASVAIAAGGKRADARLVTKALDTALRESTGAVQADLAGAVAGSPDPSIRKLLKKWLAQTRKLSDETRIAVLENLPLAGDEAAVAIILGQLPETSPQVLEAGLLALWNLSPKVLRAKGKIIVRNTAKLIDDEYRERRLLTQRGKRSAAQDDRLRMLNARNAAWVTAKLEDSPPKPLPAGAHGILGFTALWWRIIDLKPRGMRAPQPAKNAPVKYLSFRAQLSWEGWMSWAKKGR